MTKKQIRDFARVVKNGAVGNYFTLTEDGRIEEYTDGYSYCPTSVVYAHIERQDGDTIKSIMESVEEYRKMYCSR